MAAEHNNKLVQRAKAFFNNLFPIITLIYINSFISIHEIPFYRTPFFAKNKDMRGNLLKNILEVDNMGVSVQTQADYYAGNYFMMLGDCYAA